MILDLFLLTCIVCFVVDISGAMKNWKKPFSCSLCMVWWTGIIYLLCTGNFSIKGMAWVALFSFSARSISDTLFTVREIFNWILVKITPR